MKEIGASLSATSIVAITALTAMFLSASTAGAAEHLISGKKLKLKVSASGKSTLKFIA